MAPLRPDLIALVAARPLAALATTKADGRPQLSVVTYAWYPDDTLVKVSTTDRRAKVVNLRRDPRASLMVTSEDGWSYAVLEGSVELSATAREPDDETVEELVALYRDVQGEHPDWEDYRRAMVRDGRLVVRLHVERVYGLVQG